MDDNNSLTIALTNLNSMLSQLTEAFQAQTAALAELKEDLLLQDNVPEEPNDSQTDSATIIAVLNSCMCDSSAKNMASANRSNSEPESQNNIVDSLTQAYLPKFLDIKSVNEEVWDLLPHRSRTVDLAFQKVQELFLPSLSALCTWSGKLVSSIQSWIASLSCVIPTTS